ncbi:magnesium dechelatase SGRL, chloroplastic isoform X1 [Populus trichocarpa]|uniref:magnesium dechelatase SGRL, chloroplastic isoform X1 n=1 Tax=Populus trichocarpa TaxID=3694 RepID=UPI002278831D|nr:magnesium dechelatase SGRL, chloroplastic isoform X1 [Populus trichocarpa]
MACHCAHYAFSPSPHMRYFSINNITKLSSKVTKPTVLSSIDNSRASYNTLVSEAVRLLGPPAKFEASKLKVVLMGEEMNQYSAIIPRTYILSHCDFTADLTLIISNVINLDQLRGWYSKDDVVVEWKKLEGQLALHAHCYVSGPNLLLDLAAEFRYHIFSKEMPLVSVLVCNSLCTSELFGQIFGLLHTLVLFSTISKVCSSQVLEAVLDGDAALFTKHPELKDSLVWVYFHSRLPKYNRLECWGPLKDAAQGRPRDQRGFSVASKASSRISRKSG